MPDPNPWEEWSQAAWENTKHPRVGILRVGPLDLYGVIEIAEKMDTATMGLWWYSIRLVINDTVVFSENTNKNALQDMTPESLAGLSANAMTVFNKLLAWAQHEGKPFSE